MTRRTLHQRESDSSSLHGPLPLLRARAHGRAHGHLPRLLQVQLRPPLRLAKGSNYQHIRISRMHGCMEDDLRGREMGVTVRVSRGKISRLRSNSIDTILLRTELAIPGIG